MVIYTILFSRPHPSIGGCSAMSMHDAKVNEEDNSDNDG